MFVFPFIGVTVSALCSLHYLLCPCASRVIMMLVGLLAMTQKMINNGWSLVDPKKHRLLI